MSEPENVTPLDEIDAGFPPRTRCRRADCRTEREALLHDVQVVSEEADVQYQVAHAVALLLLETRDQLGAYRTAHPCPAGEIDPQSGTSEPLCEPFQVHGQVTLVEEI